MPLNAIVGPHPMYNLQGILFISRKDGLLLQSAYILNAHPSCVVYCLPSSHNSNNLCIQKTYTYEKWSTLKMLCMEAHYVALLNFSLKKNLLLLFGLKNQPPS